MKTVYLIIIISVISLFTYAQNPEISVLFIGNSLTNGNSTNISDPTTGHSIAYNFRGLAIAAGFNVHVEMYAPNGVYIYDDPSNPSNIGHCNRTTTENLINSRQWDYVVVQDNVGSYMWSECYLSSDLVNANDLLHDKIIANNPCTKEIFYSAQGYYNGLPSDYWNAGGLSLTSDDNIQASIRSYVNSVCLNDNIMEDIVTPVGLVWNRYCNDGNSRNDLYYDTAHPTEKAAYLSGITVFCSIFKMDPTDVNWNNGFADGPYLRQIAYETVMNNTIFAETNLDTYTPEVSFASNEISVNNTFSSYQWYLSPNQISDATNQAYAISQAGWYFAEVTDASGCKLRSEILNYNYVGVDTPIANNLIQLYPNPAHNEIYIRGVENVAEMQIINMRGQIVKQENSPSFINISDLPNGSYYIRITNNNKVINKLFQKY